MEEVKKQAEKEVKKKFLLSILEDLKLGKRPSKIAEENNISKQKVQYYLNKLKEKGLIKKIGYGVWEVKRLDKDTLDIKEVRGHAFMWKIKLPKINNWDKRIEILDKNKIDFKLIGLKNTPRIKFKGRKIWLGNKHIIIYEPKSFFGSDALESRKLAIFNLTSLLEDLERKFNISLKIEGNYIFSVKRDHYALIKNNLAIQCNKSGEKVYVSDINGLWFCIDNSYNLDEAETLNKNALKNNLGIQGYFNSHKKHNFNVTPDFILNGFNKLTQSQQIESEKWNFYAKHIESHTKAIITLSNKLNKLIGIKKENIILKKEKGQEKLNKWVN